MATQIDYALMAGASYISTRSEANRFSTPPGWAEQLELRARNDSSGFEATTFQRGSEIVISYAGTYDKDYLGDWVADANLAQGQWSAQLLEAAEYYLQVRAANTTSDNPNPAITLTGLDLHSQALLTAFLQSDAFRQATHSLSDLLGMIFDEQLFAHDTDPTSTKVNLLEHLVRHQAGVDGAGGDHMIDRFTGDLGRISQEGGLTMASNFLTKTLIAFAMQAYYDNRLASDAPLFGSESVSGGLRFDRANVAETLTDAKGYERYFADYLGTLSPGDSAVIEPLLAGLREWFIQAGSGSHVDGWKGCRANDCQWRMAV